MCRRKRFFWGTSFIYAWPIIVRCNYRGSQHKIYYSDFGHWEWILGPNGFQSNDILDVATILVIWKLQSKLLLVSNDPKMTCCNPSWIFIKDKLNLISKIVALASLTNTNSFSPLRIYAYLALQGPPYLLDLIC